MSSSDLPTLDRPSPPSPDSQPPGGAPGSHAAGQPAGPSAARTAADGPHPQNAGDPSAAPQPRYAAFLSYSHHDRAIARRLQRRLETYRVPKRLVGRPGSEGEVPARLGPLFRDRDELHAGADLKASVREALSRSRWLIVVCTPDAARSPWVNREIIEFKRMHGERRVLALIARGEPFASDMPGRLAEECFPPALRRALTPEGLPEGEPLEPIAADMRRHGDGPQRAALKLLAAMLGVGFDDLVRRDMQRRVRWLSAIASASVLGVVVFAALAVMAVRARNEAQHQRLQAEGLIEFMLGDLRKKLEPVGRLDVLDAVGEKALAYYGTQAPEQLDAGALGHRSRAMHLIGELRDLRGNPAEAQAAFEQAAATTEELLELRPNDGQRIFDHAQSVYWVGYAAWKKGNATQAERWWRDYLALAQRLVALDAKRPEWRAEVAYAHQNLGSLQLGTGRAGDALQSLGRARDVFAELTPQLPELRLEWSNTLGWLAIAHARQGDYTSALAEQQRQLAVLQAVPDADKNRSAQRGVLQSLSQVGMYQWALGRVAEAEASNRAALAIADELVAFDPKNVFWRGHACVAGLREADLLLALGRREEAAQAFAQASQCVAQLKAAGSLDVALAIQVRARSLVLAAQLEGAGRREALVLEGERLLNEAAPQLNAEAIGRIPLTVDLAQAALALGTLQAQADAPAARAAWQRAADLLAPFADVADGAVLTPLAQARLALGEAEPARALATRIEHTAYRHPAYVDLVQQLQAERGGSRTITNTGSKP